jgi:hypothetical protein
VLELLLVSQLLLEGGLTGEYYRGTDLNERMLTRRDPMIAFDWGEGAPAPGLAADDFSVRWSGTITPRYSETYTFIAETDDGVRVWIDGQLLIDDWNRHGVTEHSATIDLAADRSYPIVVEYFDLAVFAVAHLSWSSASQVREIVPRERLRPLQEHDAVFVRGEIPETMQAGGPHSVAITMRNIGASSWSNGFELGAKHSSDRIALEPAETIEPWSEKTFRFEMIAPETLGAYELQWQMTRDGEGFGAPTPAFAVTVLDEMQVPDAGVPPMNGMPPDAMQPQPPVMEEPASGSGCTSVSLAPRAAVPPELLGLLLLGLLRSNRRKRAQYLQ